MPVAALFGQGRLPDPVRSQPLHRFVKLTVIEYHMDLEAEASPAPITLLLLYIIYITRTYDTPFTASWLRNESTSFCRLSHLDLYTLRSLRNSSTVVGSSPCSVPVASSIVIQARS
jgi:hypothetical protein